jgi:hypothetical protein
MTHNRVCEVGEVDVVQCGDQAAPVVQVTHDYLGADLL